ncbi:MAG: HAD family hydrolase [Lachnospiraceae bacterium]|nr:HAD family hydrolase [Lachnospiraceae bacterium]
MDKKGIIFDMDGTLWDSAEGVAKSWTRIVNGEHDKNRVITVEDIHGVMGKTMDKIAEVLFPELPEAPRLELLEKCCNDENEYLRVHGGVLYPELEETLKELKKEYPLYIVSNCQSGYIEAFLEYYGFGHYFEDIECFGNNGLQKGENIRRLADRNGLTDAIYVGDIQGDYDATIEAGFSFVHAAYGFGKIAQKTPAISCFKELPAVVKQVFSEKI